MELYEKIHPEGWKDYPDTTTPIEGDNLTHIEEGIYENSVNIKENSVNIKENSVNIKENSVNIKKVNNVTKYITATAGADGDFYVDIENDLATGMVLYISFPTATNGASNARLSIDNGNSYKEIKGLRGSNNIPAAIVAGNRLTLFYDGVRWVIDDRPKISNKNCKMRPNVELSLTSGTNYIANINTVVFNNGLIADTVNNRITIPPGEKGIYLINGQAYYSQNATGRRFANILRNGDQVALASAEKSSNTTSYVNITTILELEENDFIQLQMYQDSGATLTTLPGFIYLSVVKLYDL